MPKKPKHETLTQLKVFTRPFSDEDERQIQLIARRTTGKEGQLSFSSIRRTVLIESDEISVNAVVSLVETLIKAGGGTLCWAQDGAAFSLRRLYKDLIAFKAGDYPNPPIDFEPIRDAEAYILSGKLTFYCLSVGSVTSKIDALLAVEELKRLSGTCIVEDNNRQLEYLSEFYVEADALLRRRFPDHDDNLRLHAAEVFACLLQDYKAKRVDRFEKLTGLLMGKLFVTPKQTRKLSELPEPYEWPTEQFEGSPEHKTRHGIVRFLERVWKDLIDANLADTGHLAIVDNYAAKALANYLYNNGGERRNLPAHVAMRPKRQHGLSAERQRRPKPGN